MSVRRERSNLEAELAERESWLDHVPEEIEYAVGWLMGEWKRLTSIETELNRRLRELEAELAAKTAELERKTRLRRMLARAAAPVRHGLRRLRDRT